MSLFVFFVLVGALFHQLISAIQPLRKPGSSQRVIEFGRKIVLTLPERAYVALNAIFFGLLFFLFISAAILIVVKNVHPSSGYAYRFTDADAGP
jgi:hypothetical protein